MNASIELVNNMMIDLDEYLTPQLKNIYKHMGFIYHSYLWRDDVELVKRGEQNHIAFRHPGSTKGHIVVDKNLIITDIVFYKDTCKNVYCGNYEDDIKKKYIGTKLNLEEIKNDNK